GGVSGQLFFPPQTARIRLYVNVPEIYAPSITPGLAASLELTQYPGRRFQAQIVRSADAIDQGTRTLLTEVDVPNRAGELLPGGYAQVHLAIKVASVRLAVPVNSLLFRAEGLRAVVVDSDHKTHLKALTIGRDYGTSLEVLQGLEPGDWIVVNRPDSLDEGQQVNVKEPRSPSPASGQGTKGAGQNPPQTPPPGKKQ